MKIINNTDLSCKEIKMIIDQIKEKFKEDTHYIGKVEIIKEEYKEKKLYITITYFKEYVEWRFDYNTIHIRLF